MLSASEVPIRSEPPTCGLGWSSLPRGLRTRRNQPKPLRVVIVGWGAIAHACYEVLDTRGSPVELVGIGIRPGVTIVDPRIERVPRLSSPEELSTVEPDVVLEAASRSAVKPWGSAALALGKDFIPCSVGAFCNAEVFDEILRAAHRGGGQVLIPAGALAGLDGLAAASLLELNEVSHIVTKPPQAWRGTEAELSIDLARLEAPTTFFEGTAREAARRFPANANAAAAVALATIGLDRTRVSLVADPATVGNSHELRARGEFGNLTLRLENAAMAGNPKSSLLTALSLVRLIEHRSSIVLI